MVQVLCRYLWSLVSWWLKAICQFEPPVETTVYDDLQGSIALCRDYGRTNAIWHKKTKRIIYRYAVENWQIDSSVCFLISCENISDWGTLWVHLSIESGSCTFTFALTAAMHVFFFLFFLHVCFFCRHLRQGICMHLFFFDLSLGRGSNIVQLSISEREGLIGEVSGKSCSDRHMNFSDNQVSWSCFCHLLFLCK